MGVPGAAASGEGPACSWCGVPSVAWRLTRGGRSSNVGWWSDAERVRSVPDATSATASGRAPRPADALTAPSRGSVRDQPYGPESPVLRLARAAGTAAPFPSCGVLGRGRRAGGGPPSPRPTPFQDRAGVSQENRARCQRSESRLSAQMRPPGPARCQRSSHGFRPAPRRPVRLPRNLAGPRVDCCSRPSFPARHGCGRSPAQSLDLIELAEATDPEKGRMFGGYSRPSRA